MSSIKESWKSVQSNKSILHNRLLCIIQLYSMHILTNTHTHSNTHSNTLLSIIFALYIGKVVWNYAKVGRKKWWKWRWGINGKNANMSDENIDVFVLSGNTAEYVEIVLVLVSRPNCEWMAECICGIFHYKLFDKCNKNEANGLLIYTELNNSRPPTIIDYCSQPYSLIESIQTIETVETVETIQRPEVLANVAVRGHLANNENHHTIAFQLQRIIQRLWQNFTQI